MYIETKRQLGTDTVEINQYAYGLFGAPGKGRRHKSKKQTEQVKKKNRKNRARYLRRLLLCNFKPGDLSVVLQYRKEDRPETYEEGKERLRGFLKRIRKYYKERGYVLKYIAVTERGKRRAVLHHHVILESIDENRLHTLPAIMACWDGYVKASVMYEDGGFEQLAEYMVKEEGKEECEGATYSRSRNLIEPVVEKKVIFKKDIPEPQAPPGWYVDKSSVVRGVNPYSGKTYQRYFLKRIRGYKEPDARQLTIQESKLSSLIDKAKKAAGRILRRKGRT